TAELPGVGQIDAIRPNRGAWDPSHTPSVPTGAAPPHKSIGGKRLKRRASRDICPFGSVPTGAPDTTPHPRTPPCATPAVARPGARFLPPCPPGANPACVPSARPHGNRYPDKGEAICDFSEHFW